MSRCIYRVVSREDWEQAQALGHVPRSGADDRDGFVHLSTLETVLQTANLYFDVSEEPRVLKIDAALLGDDLKWESVASRGGARFPHLYAPGIPLSTVQAAIILEHAEEQGFHFRAGEDRSVPPQDLSGIDAS